VRTFRPAELLSFHPSSTVELGVEARHERLWLAAAFDELTAAI
jgi:hypothetical protein